MTDSEDDNEALKQVIVTVDDAAFSDLDGVTSRLEEAGMEVQERLDFLGQIIGTAGQVSALREVEGVSDVSESGRVQLAPPGSKLQ